MTTAYELKEIKKAVCERTERRSATDAEIDYVLNRVYAAAVALIYQIDNGNLGLNCHNALVNLRRAVADAEGRLE
jgi:hypothetical protein